MPILSARGGASAGAYGWGALTTAAGTPSFESIASVTGNGSATSLTFSSIPTGFTHLQIRGMTYSASVGTRLTGIQMNSDTANNYGEHYIAAQGSTLYVNGVAGGTYGQIDVDILGSNLAGVPYVSIIDIADYLSTSKWKTAVAFSGIDRNNTTNSGINVVTGVWRSTSAINSIKLIGDSSWGSNTEFGLYGIKEKA